MQILKTQLKDEKAELFRRKAMEKFGHSKGAISKALNEAIDKWIARGKGKRAFSISELKGIVSDLKESSLAAQKKAVKWVSEAD